MKRCRCPGGKSGAKNDGASVATDVVLSSRTMETVVVFSSNEDFIDLSNDALTKQGFTLLGVDSQARLIECCSGGYLNYLLDLGGMEFRRARSVTMSIRARAPNSSIVAFCPETEWGSRLKEAGASVVIKGRNDVTVQIMEASTGFLENINAIISQHLRSTRQKMKETSIRSRIEKAAAQVAHLSLQHMLQTDANVRTFLTNSWPASRHGQYVAIIGGETIGFADEAGKLAEQIRSLRPRGNILIQKIDCEDDSLRQHVK